MAGKVSGTSWFASGPHLRIYTSHNGAITEQCWDGDGPWYKGALTGQANGETVGSTSWLDSSGQIHIRVYVAADNKIIEKCWDKDEWYTGAYSSTGTGASATSWLDGGGNLHIRVYARQGDGSVVEKCWDGSGPWYDGAYQGKA